MPYIELYDDDILDVISLGEFASDFNELRGDYIKVQVLRGDSEAILDTFYSNRILFKYPTVDEYYFGDYHYHPDQTDMGFCTQRVHMDESITNLKPLLYGGSINEPLNSETKYSTMALSKSSPPKNVSPLVDLTSKTPSPNSSIDTSNVPPPKSYTAIFLCCFFSNP